MPWWGWVLIVLGLVGLGYLKLILFNKIKNKSEHKHHEDDSD